MNSLHRDIENLISGARNDFANNPLDPSIQQRLKALLDLQNILQQQKLPESQLKLIRDQVSKLSLNTQPGPQGPSIMPAPPASATPVSTTPIPPVPTPTPQPNVQNLLNSGTLADLIKATSNQQNPTPTPPNSHAFPQATSTPPNLPAGAGENPLIASLRARGLLPAATGAPASQTPSNFPFVMPGQNGYTPSATPMQLPNSVNISVQMTSASMKM